MIVSGAFGMAEHNPIRDWHQVAVEMLMTDADLALLSLSCVFSWDDRASVARLAQRTRLTYDSICARRKELKLSDDESAWLDQKMDRLRARLRSLGEAV